LEAININRSTFYVYFKDGYEILDEIEKQTITAGDFSDIIIERIFHATEKKDMLELVLQFFENNKKYLPVLLSEQGDPRLPLIHHYFRKSHEIFYINFTTII